VDDFYVSIEDALRGRGGYESLYSDLCLFLTDILKFSQYPNATVLTTTPFDEEGQPQDHLSIMKGIELLSKERLFQTEIPIFYDSAEFNPGVILIFVEGLDEPRIMRPLALVYPQDRETQSDLLGIEDNYVNNIVILAKDEKIFNMIKLFLDLVEARNNYPLDSTSS